MAVLTILSWVLVVLFVSAAIYRAKHVPEKVFKVIEIMAGVLSQTCVLAISPEWLLLWAVWIVAFAWNTKSAGRSIQEWRWSVLLAEAICVVSFAGALLAS